MSARLDAGQRLLAVALVLGVTLVAFETTAVVTALPTITDELGGDSLYGLALAAYTLADLAALVLSGYVADRRGPIVPFVISILTFVAGLVIAGAATSMTVVVAGRLLQGAGTGGFAPLAYVMVKRAFPTARQPTMYALLSAGWVLPSLAAPAFAGVVVDRFGWEWVFFGIIPLALGVGAMGIGPMRRWSARPERDRPGDHAGGTAGPGDDTPGRRRIGAAVAAALGVGLVVTGLRLADPLWVGVYVVAGTAMALPALHYLLPAGFFTARAGLPAILACRVLATATFLGVDSFIPLAADRIHGARPLVQGLTIAGAAIAWTLGQWMSSRHPERSPVRAVGFGFGTMLCGVILVVPVLHSGWPLWATFLGWALGGFGIGLLFNPTTLAAMSYARSGNEGAISSQVQLCDALGFAVMGGIGGATVAFADRTDVDLRAALGTNFGLAAVLATIGLVASRRVRAAQPPAPSMTIDGGNSQNVRSPAGSSSIDTWTST